MDAPNAPIVRRLASGAVTMIECESCVLCERKDARSVGRRNRAHDNGYKRRSVSGGRARLVALTALADRDGDGGRAVGDGGGGFTALCARPTEVGHH